MANYHEGTFETELAKIELTQNQEKVIKDKYLKDDVSVEAWLHRVARNIALTEILYSPKVKKEAIFEGINHFIEKTETMPGEFSEVFLVHKGLDTYSKRDANFKKFIANLYKTAEDDKHASELVSKWEKKFYNLMATFTFLPNSPTLMNAGRDLQQLSGCYVLPIDDSIEGWMETVKNTAIIHKTGGGTGFSVSRVRPSGDSVRTTKGVSSGPLSPLIMINSVTEQIKQGGARRGANMGILSIYHPDIEKFIVVKRTPGTLENFNISVAIDEKFMSAVENDEEIELVNPRSKAVARKVKAHALFDMICKNAWENGDPGFVVIDRINASNSNPTPALGEIESTNPCGEQPLLPYEVCNLGSINLSKFVNNGEVDWDRFADTIKLCARFMDDVIDVNNYPLAEIEAMAKGNRRIGFGVMGWAEMLVQLGIPYDSDGAIIMAEKVMKFVNDTALHASEMIAEERGVFPNFKDSIYDERGKYFRIKAKPRNCARTTIAPTGTIAIAAGLQGSGIEPFFSIAYTRYNAKGIDALKEGRTPEEENTFYENNNIFAKVAEEHGYFDLKPKDLWQKVVDNHGSVRGIKEIPEHLQKIFTCAYDVPPKYHILHQAAFQRYTDNAVSKTINLPNSATVEDIKDAYWFAFKEGVKGITVYRDGSKAFQVLSTTKQESKQEKFGDEKTAAVKAAEVGPRPRPEMLKGATYKIKTGYGSLFVTINNDEKGKPFEVFATTGKTGGVLAAKSEAICRLISLALRAGIDVEIIIDQLLGIRGPIPTFSKFGIVFSIPDAIAKILKVHINAGQTQLSEFSKSEIHQQLPFVKPANGNEKKTIADSGDLPECPDCHNILEFGEGCVICHFCGYSKCG
ncbi:MAG: vitamin B12-dependent ribonucleotide reductase [archaeon]